MHVFGVPSTVSSGEAAVGFRLHQGSGFTVTLYRLLWFELDLYRFPASFWLEREVRVIVFGVGSW